MAAMHGSVRTLEVEDEDYDLNEEHEFEQSAQDFLEQGDWHEVATGRNDYEKKVTISEKVHPMNILNIRDPVICTHENHKIPSILEIIDSGFLLGTYFSKVYFLRALFILCLIKYV